MKKIIWIFLFGFICTICYAASVPEWSEFCPEEYINPKILSGEEIKEKARELANNRKKMWFCTSDKTFAKVMRGVTVLPAMCCGFGDWNYNEVYKDLLKQHNKAVAYWVERKRQFYNELSSCEGLSNDAKGMCYLEVRKIEHQKNDNRQVQANLKAIQKQLWYNNLTE